MRKTAFAKFETDVGINYCPNGILFYRTLQGVYSAVDHTIVDWMHTMCSDGVGNTCIWTVMQILKAAGYAPSDVRELVTIVRMPSKARQILRGFMTIASKEHRTAHYRMSS